ncbi:hypothetical protein L7F22_056244 [Adiantum nelumboides]|nr:hypothetical protein [Adiantum nelumboides]
MYRRPVTVTVTGAAGQISYALLFRIASGDLLGPDTPVRLNLLRSRPRSPRGPTGSRWSWRTAPSPCCARSRSPTTRWSHSTAARSGCSSVLAPGQGHGTVGPARGQRRHLRSPGGAAINTVAADDVRLLVVGNPANTNALITRANAPDVPADRFTSMMRLDHNRAVARLAGHLGVGSGEVRRMAVWGNHSSTQYPDLTHAEVDGAGVVDRLDPTWVRKDFIPTVAAVALRSSTPVVHRRGVCRQRRGRPGPSGLLVPVRATGVGYDVVRDLDVDPFSRERIEATVAELVAERDAVRAAGLIR